MELTIRTKIDTLSVTPIDEALAQDFDSHFAQEVCDLKPKKSSFFFHVLAQQAARTNQRLFDKLLATPSDRSIISQELEKFLGTCPDSLRPYLNCYFYLLFAAPDTTRTAEPKLWQGKDFTTFKTTENCLAHLIGDFSTTKDFVLQVIVLNTKTKERFLLLQNYLRYLLIMGANPDQMVTAPTSCKCCSCDENTLIPSFTKKPLLTYCSGTELRDLLHEYLPTTDKT